jgi:isopentenyl-diphosphate delta-isomerase
MNENEKKYHQQRRMFFLIDKKLVVVKKGVSLCHFDWLVSQGWTKKDAEKFISKELRGVIDPDGNLKFFVGKKWELNEEIEKKFFEIFPELVKRLKLKDEVKIYGGAIEKEIGQIWPGRKYYGSIGELINNGVILVDKNDEIIGIEEKMEAHENGGKRHRAFSVLIFNKKNELMLQQRAIDKYHCGGLWTNTCCSHPRLNETTIKAAHRRLMEEMGFNTKLKEIFSFKYQVELDHGLSENEYDHVYVGKYNRIPKINPKEVKDWKWVSIEDLDQDIKDNRKSYTPWFRKIWKEFRK